HFRRTFDQLSLRQELVEAGKELEQSVTLFKKAGETKNSAYSLFKLGDVRRMLNDWDTAILTYELALSEAREANAPGIQCKALLGNARAYLYGKKNSGPALERVRQAIPLCQQSANPDFIFDGWDLLTQIQVTEGDYIGAADTINKAFAVKKSVKDDKQLFYGYLDRADVYQHFAEKCDYERNFKPCLDGVEHARRDYEAAYQVAKRLGWDGLAKQTQEFLQRLEIRRQMIESQQRMHSMIVKTDIFSPTTARDVVIDQQFTPGQNPQLSGLFAWLEKQGGMSVQEDARGAYINGLLKEMEGQRDASLEWYLRAVNLLEEDRGFLYDERSRNDYIEDKVEFYYTTLLNLLDRGRNQEAFELMERARSRVMSDLLATKKLAFSSSGEQSLYAAMLETRGEIARLQSCLFSARSASPATKNCHSLAQSGIGNVGEKRGVTVSDDPGVQPSVDPKKLEAHLEQRQKQFSQLRDRIAKDAPNLERLITSKPATLTDLQKTLLEDGSEMIAYLSLESQVLIWHIGPNSLHVRSVFLPRSALKEKIALIRNSLTDPKRPFDDKTAHELYLYLISPVLEWIQSDRVVIVPHEDLNYLPFQALQMERGGRYLGEDYRLSYVPSATVLVGLESVKSLGQAKLLAAADPSLTFAPGEVRGIGQYFSGHIVADDLPMETDIKAWMPGNGLIHLAVHGSFESEEPLLSYLHLKAGKNDNGKLTAAEMYGLSLDSTKLIVLSACETGSVRATHANEVIGMMRGLLFAGADSLVLSAWKIDDKATAEWMQAFYADAVNHPPATAVRAAIRELRAKPGYQHPYYWSPFLLISR
ncbi:MAG: CHAT domain-containing protein, partial [Gammaproteobacteria bacterium]